MANIIFFNAQIVDSTINSKGALLVQEDKILAVVQGDFSREEDANKFKSFFDTEDDIQLFDFQNKTLITFDIQDKLKKKICNQDFLPLLQEVLEL